MTTERRNAELLFGRSQGLCSLFSYIYCLIVSQDLLGVPLYGGALFMCGEVATTYFTTYAGA